MEREAKLRNYDKMAIHMDSIKRMSESLVTKLTTQLLEPLIEAIKPIAKLLYNALEGDYRQCMVGEILIRCIAETSIQKLDNVLRGTQSVVPHRCLKLILTMVKGRNDAVRHLAELYISPQSKGKSPSPHAIKEALRVINFLPWLNRHRQEVEESEFDRKGGTSKNNDDDNESLGNYSRGISVATYKESPFYIFVDYLKAEKARELNRALRTRNEKTLIDAELEDENKSSSFETKNLDSNEYIQSLYSKENRELLQEFLLERSVWNSVSLQIPIRAVHRFLVPYLDTLAPTITHKIQETSIMTWALTLRHELKDYITDLSGGITFEETLYCEESDHKTNSNPWILLASKPQRWREIPDVYMNLRLDLFMADQELPIWHNVECISWTPRYEDFVVREKNQARHVQQHEQLPILNQNAMPGINPSKPPSHANIKRISRSDCIQLWFTLSNPRYTSIVNDPDTEENWGFILKQLEEDRKSALESGDSTMVDHFEFCRRFIRQLAHKDINTCIQFDFDHAEEEVASFNYNPKLTSIKASKGGNAVLMGNYSSSSLVDVLKPPELFFRLRDIHHRAQLAKMVLEENLQIIKFLNKRVKGAVRLKIDQHKELTKIFRRLTLSTKEERKGDSMRGFFETWQGPYDHSSIRYHRSINVYRV
mmetsp:Transcript_4874/g.6894  ORF Transcript_4874/g.6894 Transcript_4874/m.6894 type:complete len:653 (+) Transcript_4874:2191-4149(+)